MVMVNGKQETGVVGETILDFLKNAKRQLKISLSNKTGKLFTARISTQLKFPKTTNWN